MGSEQLKWSSARWNLHFSLQQASHCVHTMRQQ